MISPTTLAHGGIEFCYRACFPLLLEHRQERDHFVLRRLALGISAARSGACRCTIRAAVAWENEEAKWSAGPRKPPHRNWRERLFRAELETRELEKEQRTQTQWWDEADALMTLHQRVLFTPHISVFSGSKIKSMRISARSGAKPKETQIFYATCQKGNCKYSPS
jgi:hypothetical protein